MASRATRSLGVVSGVLLIAAALPAAAQRVPFEHSYTVGANGVLDVSTNNGKIEVLAGESGRVTVAGTVTVRNKGWNVPVNAPEIARRLAAKPPVQQEGSTLRLRRPDADDERRAVTIAYRVTVPRDMKVTTVSDSGATMITGVAGHVAVRTQSAAITLRDLGGSADVTTGSGAVNVSGVASALSVTTSSSAITLRKLGGGLRARTQSGAVRAWFIGQGDVDVETGSSAIDLDGVRGGLIASTNSGHLRVMGMPLSAWQIAKHSGGADITFGPGAAATLEVSSGNGKIDVEGLDIAGSSTERMIAGTVKGGGALVRVTSRSGTLKISGS
jgi:Putative adhesin